LGAAAVVLVLVAATGIAANASRRAASRPSKAAAATTSLTTCPASQPLSALPLFAKPGLTEIPDDLTVDANGDVWVTVEVQGHILRFAPGGALKQDIPDPNGPEGIIVTPTVTMVADQLTSRVDRLGPNGQLVTFVKLPNPHHRLAVDGLGFDAQRQRLLIPNSPEGTLLATPITKPAPRLLASGLGRPVAATIGPDGAIYVAAESNVGLVRIPPNGGAPKRVGALTNLDEVVTVGHLLYTTGAGDHTVRAVDPTTGSDVVLVTGGHELQGLEPLADGRLLVIDSLTHAISFVQSCP
jgi:sugar lactone lactonase YvrE